MHVILPVLLSHLETNFVWWFINLSCSVLQKDWIAIITVRVTVAEGSAPLKGTVSSISYGLLNLFAARLYVMVLS